MTGSSDQPRKRRTAKLRRFEDLLLAALVLVAVDVGLFHAGGYFGSLSPYSYSGQFERHHRRLQSFLSTFPDRKLVVVVGNSATIEGVQEQQLESRLAEAGGSQLVVNIAQGGSSMRAWEPILDNEGLRGSNTDLVVIGIMTSVFWQGWKADVDLETFKTRLGVADTLALASTFSDMDRTLPALFGAFYRTPMFAADVRDYLKAPRQRRSSIATELASEKGFPLEGRRANPVECDLLSARLEGDHLAMEELAPCVKSQPLMLGSLEKVLLSARNPPPLAPVDVDPIQVRMLGQTVRLLSGRGIRVVLALVPDTPFPRLSQHVTGLREAVQTLRSQGLNVVWWEDRATLDVLRTPRYFKDVLHLNAEGARIYTEALGSFLAEDLAAAGRLPQR